MELLKRAAPILSRDGWTLANIAALGGYSTAGSIRSLGIVAVDRTPHERNGRMVEMYRTGKTLEEIGLAFGVTRERVRQIVRKPGVGRDEGGRVVRRKGRGVEQAERRVLRAESVKRRRDAISQRNFGCDYETAKRLNEHQQLYLTGTRSALYFRQLRSAGQRGITWAMTFPEWCAVWDASGKWHLRGRGKHYYCMARNGDIGPYASGNVRIITNSENASEGYIKTPWSERFPHLSTNVGHKMLAAYRMRTEEGKTSAEIAEALDIKASTATGYVHAGKRLTQSA